jgi:hypothetical protein
MKLMRKITAIFIIGFFVSVVLILFIGFHVFGYQGKDEPPAQEIPYSKKIEKSATEQGLYETTNEPIIHHVNDIYNDQDN